MNFSLNPKQKKNKKQLSYSEPQSLFRIKIYTKTHKYMPLQQKQKSSQKKKETKNSNK